MLLKPMSVGEILDTTITLYKKQFKSYLVFGACMAVIAGLPQLLIEPGTKSLTQNLLLFPVIILASIINICLYGGLTKKVSKQILDKTISVQEALSFGFSKCLYIFIASILYGIVVTIGFILLFIPGMYLLVAGCFIYQGIVIEDEGPWSAFKKSKELVKGDWWRTFGIFLLIILFTYLIMILVGLVLGIPAAFLINYGANGKFINFILTVPLNCLAMPLPAIGATLLYYDLKIRKESFDLKLMVDDLTDRNNMN